MSNNFLNHPISVDIPNFTWAEVVDKETEYVRLHERFWRHMYKLQALRKWYRKPMPITSGYRNLSYNQAVGGSPNSQHLLLPDDYRFATDIALPLGDIDAVTAQARGLGFSHGSYDWGIHLDLGPVRNWDHRTERAEHDR